MYAVRRSSCSDQKRSYRRNQAIACSNGAAVRLQITVRPVLVREIRAASVSTSRCFMIAGSDMGNGRAKSLTDALSPSLSWVMSARRVGSASAAKT
jgi:hypothetical protein